MGRFQNAPIYISEFSAFSKDQKNYLNNMLSNYYKDLQLRSKQKQLEAKVSNVVSKWSGRVDGITSYCDGESVIHIYFGLYLKDLSKDVSTFLCSVDSPLPIKDFSYNGYEGDDMRVPITSLGYISVEGSDISFTLTTEASEDISYLRCEVTLFLGVADRSE